MEVPAGFHTAAKEHRSRLTRVMEKGGVQPLKRLYDQAQLELEAKLLKLVGSANKQFTAHQHKAMLAQIKQGQIQIARRMAEAMGKLSKEAQVTALRGLVKDIVSLEKQFTGATVPVPIEEAARFAGVIDKHRTSLLSVHRLSMAKYGAQVVTRMQDHIAQSLIQGETAGQAIDRIQSVADMEWYQAERIVRTEQAWAYNATHADGILELSEDIPDLMQRWTEFVSDSTMSPLDDRVGKDSIAMHGQLAPPGGRFTMPPGEPGVSSTLWGQSWLFPPNRPNDRAVLQPWRKHWGVPGWVYRGGEKIWM